MNFTLDKAEMRELVREVVSATLATLDWPVGRVALTESEAAQACGVGRHVLRDLRIAGRIQARRLGRRIVYTREDLLRALVTASALESR
jgi:hypothetical protein